MSSMSNFTSHVHVLVKIYLSYSFGFSLELVGSHALDAFIDVEKEIDGLDGLMEL